METAYNEYCLTYQQSKKFRGNVVWLCSCCGVALRPIKNDYEKRSLHLSCIPKWEETMKTAISCR